MGPDLCAEEHSVRIRRPNPDGPISCRWHRDVGTGASEIPHSTPYISVVFYLNDVDDTTHTFSVLPGSAHTREQPLDAYDLAQADHITGPAGTAVLFNAIMYHAGNVRQTTAGTSNYSSLLWSYDRPLLKQLYHFPRADFRKVRTKPRGNTTVVPIRLPNCC